MNFRKILPRGNKNDASLLSLVPTLKLFSPTSLYLHIRTINCPGKSNINVNTAAHQVSLQTKVFKKIPDSSDKAIIVLNPPTDL